jgi:23S rRNA (cytidine1920-2'-O)/16S rRNA (cytidine1409-2'-O)-methyltransferase
LDKSEKQVKKRLDQEIVSRALASSRAMAQALILEGKVRVSGQVERKASRSVDEATEIEIEAPPRFVSRGGEKLEGAFALWGAGEGALLDVTGKVCIDVGSSTGGFTDCLLQHGAARVMAVDVGTNQLAYKLRVDPRVWVKENFNARYMTPSDLPDVPEVAVTDVSFISLKLILPPIVDVLAPGGLIVALIKPQFEVGRGNAPGGLVRDEALRNEAKDSVVDFAVRNLGLELIALAQSPIKGKEMGNIEFLSFWRKSK